MARTRGNVVVQEIKVGDIHYEYELNLEVEVEVISKPQRDEAGVWRWQSKRTSDGRIIDYIVHEGLEHFSSKLYDYQAYFNCTRV